LAVREDDFMSKIVDTKHGILLIVPVVVLIFTECTTTQYYTAKDTRHWENCEYIEEYLIQTEPPDCRIYIQENYTGNSPCTGTISGTKFKMYQNGYHTVSYLRDELIGQNSNFKRTTDTTWNGNLYSEPLSYRYVIKAFKEGYQPAERIIKINSSDTVFMEALASENPDYNGRILTKYKGKRTILITLYPIGTYNPDQGTSRENNQSGRYTDKSNSDYEQAKQEYNNALAEYQKALEELQTARNMRDINSLAGGMATDKTGVLLGLVGQGSSIYLVRDAETKVRIARERLERAKERLAILESK
jgi:hypothetical protein